MNSQTFIQVGFNERTVWVRVSGRGSFQNSGPLKDFAKEMLARGYKSFVIDLGECPVMDSTFMGTLAGIALKLQASILVKGSTSGLLYLGSVCLK